MKKILFIFLLCNVYFGFSQQIEFVAESGRTTYGLNERIQITYTINNLGENFKAPSFKGFKVEGPSTFRGNASVISNDLEVKKQAYLQLKYYLTPIEKGTYTIKPARIKYAGKKYYSNELTIDITTPITESSNL